MIFTDIEQFKESVGGGVNSSVELASLQPAYREVIQKNIIPLLGDQLWNTIDTSWDNNPAAETTAILPYIRRAIAHLTMFEYSHIGNVQFSESGLVRMETEQMKTAYKYQERQYKIWMRNTGYNRIEDLQLFLMENAADYPDWDSSLAYKHLINSARTFRAYYGKQVNRYLFEVLTGIMEEVEITVVEANLGSDFYQRLISGQQAGDLTTEEETALSMLYRCVAHYTIEEAMIRQYVTFEGDSVVRFEGAVQQTYTAERPGTDKDVVLAKQYHQYRAKIHLGRVLNYLQADLDNFPAYKTFYQAQQAELEEDEDTVDVRSDYPNAPTSSDEEQGGVIRW